VKEGEPAGWMSRTHALWPLQESVSVCYIGPTGSPVARRINLKLPPVELVPMTVSDVGRVPPFLHVDREGSEHMGVRLFLLLKRHGLKTVRVQALEHLGVGASQGDDRRLSLFGHRPFVVAAARRRDGRFAAGSQG